MSHLNSITLEWRNATPQLISVEFMLDGCLLREHCERATKQTYGVVSPLGWTPFEYQISFIERLLLRHPPLLESGRQELLVCSECADLGCGCISAEVSSEGENFMWSNIGYENDYDPDALTIFPMGRFIFSKAQFLDQIRSYFPNSTF